MERDTEVLRRDDGETRWCSLNDFPWVLWLISETKVYRCRKEVKNSRSKRNKPD
jgi:hypothetical protein